MAKPNDGSEGSHAREFFRSTLVRVIALVGSMSGLSAENTFAQSDDTIPSVVVPCQNCVTVAQLQAAAESYFQQWKHATPPGLPAGKKVRPCTVSTYNYAAGEPVEYYYPSCTTAIVVGIANPVSGAFSFSLHDFTNHAVYTDGNLSDTRSAMDFDNEILSRSSKTEPIELGSGVTPSDGDETISGRLDGIFPIDPTTRDSSWWHFFTHLPDLEVVSYEFINSDTGESVRVYIGGTIHVRYANGQTEVWKLTDVASSIKWRRVEGSLRNPDGTDPARDPAENQAAVPQTEATVSFDVDYGDAFSTFNVIPVYYAPATRIDRAGAVTITQLFGGDTTLTYHH